MRLAEPEPAGGLDPAMAGQDGAVLVDEHRVGEAECFEAFGDLLELPLRVGAGVCAKRLELRDGAGLNFP